MVALRVGTCRGLNSRRSAAILYVTYAVRSAITATADLFAHNAIEKCFELHEICGISGVIKPVIIKSNWPHTSIGWQPATLTDSSVGQKPLGQKPTRT